MKKLENKKLKLGKRLYIKDIEYRRDLIYMKAIYSKSNLFNLTEELKKDEKVSCLIDKGFKTIIMNTKKPYYIASLLSSIFDISYEEVLSNMKFVKNELDKRELDDISYRCDGVVELFGNLILIEINRTRQEERNMRYLERLGDSHINYKGYSDFPISCFLININDYAYKVSKRTSEMLQIGNREGNLLTNYKQIFDIYIPNIEEKYYNKKELTEIERKIIAMTTNIKVAKELAKEDRIMGELIEDQIILKNSRFFYDSYEDEINMKNSYIERGREEGMEAGMEAGESKKEAETVHKMYKKGFSVEDISDTLELDLSYIQSLLNI